MELLQFKIYLIFFQSCLTKEVILQSCTLYNSPITSKTACLISTKWGINIALDTSTKPFAVQML